MFFSEPSDVSRGNSLIFKDQNFPFPGWFSLLSVVPTRFQGVYRGEERERTTCCDLRAKKNFLFDGGGEGEKRPRSIYTDGR